MPSPENLDLTIRRLTDGFKFETVRVFADPDDTPALRDIFIDHARTLGRHDNSTRWANRYEARFVVVKRPSVEILLIGQAGE